MKRPDAKRLRDSVEAALERFDPAEMLPLLHRLSKTAGAGSDEYLFAHRLLAMLLCEEHPWRASLHARRVLAVRSTDDRAWAALGLSQALLGHFRFAKASYERALELAPNNPWYAHNLGHLFDVALDAPERALEHLSRAYASLPDDGDVMLAYAHALARAGQIEEAEALLSSRLPRGKEKRALKEWLTSCVEERRLYHLGRSLAGGPSRDGTGEHRVIPLAPAESVPHDAPSAPMLTSRNESSHKRRRGVRRGGTSTTTTTAEPSDASAVSLANSASASVATGVTFGVLPELEPSWRPRVRTRPRAKFMLFLARELRRLPLTDAQRERAAALAHEVFHGRTSHGALAAFSDDERAAIVAYALVYVDEMPLSCAEVASTFRIPTSRVRGGFTKLRTQVRLIRRDPRF